MSLSGVRGSSGWSIALVASCVCAQGCSKPHTESGAPRSGASRSSSAAPPTATLAPAPARSSGAPHQGVTAALGAGKVRVSAIAAGSVQVWLMDEHEKLRSPERVKARLALDIPGYPEIPLAPDGDHLKGKGPPILAPHPNATVFVEASGTTDQARLTLHLEIGPVGHHHEHEPDAAP